MTFPAVGRFPAVFDPHIRRGGSRRKITFQDETSERGKWNSSWIVLQ